MANLSIVRQTYVIGHGIETRAGTSLVTCCEVWHLEFVRARCGNMLELGIEASPVQPAKLWSLSALSLLFG